jgi:predicted amidohydrolase YtcJ
MRKLLSAGALAISLAAAQPSMPPGPPADLALLDATILTVDDHFRVVKALAVRDGRFVAVGSNEDVRRHIGSTTRVIDGRGRAVVPGIIDTHVHALDVAAAEAAQGFVNLPSIAALQAWIRKAVGDAWIWTPRVYPTRLRDGRFPTREELDAAAPDRPVVVDGAYAFVLNTAALRAAGITRDSPNPPGGSIVKNAAGEPTGLLRNAGGLLSRFRPAAGQLSLDVLEQVHRQYLAAGITSVIERGATVDGYHLYEALRRANRLHVRASVTVRIPRPDDPAEVERFIKGLSFRFGQGDDWLKAGPLKIVADGGILIGTSFMRRPYGAGAHDLYAIDDPEYRGFLTLTPQQIASAIAIGHRLGWQMVAHVTGDAGVDVVLDAIEAAQKADPAPDRRHTLIHAYFVDRETAIRAARLGVLVDTQPAWHYKDADALSSALGRDRLAHFIGLRTWRDAGVEVAINTDHMLGLDPNESLNPFNPFLTMYSATTRRTESGQRIGESEAVSREEALRMMTSAAARFSFDEKNRGSIETGKLADFVVLDADFMTVPPERLRAIRPEVTVVGGRIAFERNQNAPATEQARVIRLGIIGTDTSHATAFTQILNDASSPNHVPGARVVAAFKGGSPDVEASRTRVDRFAAELADKWGVQFVGSIEELCANVDAVLLLSDDGRPHLSQVRPVFKAGKRVFIDKPLAASYADAREIARLSKETGVPFFSSSSLRYAPDVQALRKNDKLGEIMGAFTFGPENLEPHHPDLFWYGIHTVEMLYTLLGPGCETVSRVKTESSDTVTCRWKDARLGTMRGLIKGRQDYGGVAFGKDAVLSTAVPMKGGAYPELLVEVVKFFQTGVSPVPPEETLEIMAFMEAAEISKVRGGAAVALTEVTQRRSR